MSRKAYKSSYVRSIYRRWTGREDLLEKVRRIILWSSRCHDHGMKSPPKTRDSSARDGSHGK